MVGPDPTISGQQGNTEPVSRIPRHGRARPDHLRPIGQRRTGPHPSPVMPTQVGIHDCPTAAQPARPRKPHKQRRILTIVSTHESRDSVSPHATSTTHRNPGAREPRTRRLTLQGVLECPRRSHAIPGSRCMRCFRRAHPPSLSSPAGARPTTEVFFTRMNTDKHDDRHPCRPRGLHPPPTHTEPATSDAHHVHLCSSV